MKKQKGPKVPQESINPQDIVSMPEADVDVAKCTGCGANISFDPNIQRLSCEYCGTTLDFSRTVSTEKQSIQQLFDAKATWKDEVNMFCCDSCGAVEVISSTEISKECPYCRSQSVRTVENIAGVKPDAVLPFALDVQRANKIAKDWVSKKWLAPKWYKKSFEARNLRGIYNPSFLFDSQTFSKYRGSLGQHYTVTRQTRNGTTVETMTRWFRVSGPHYDNVKDITIHACERKVSTRDIAMLAPFDVSNLKVYSDAYLQGFVVNHYTKDGQQSWDEAKQLIERMVRSNIMTSLRHKYRYDVVGTFNVDTHCYNIAYKYALLPIYVGYSVYKDKQYNFFINGHSGRIVGKTPKSAGKIWTLIGLGAFIVGAAVAATLLLI